MKIDEKIQYLQSQLIKVLTESKGKEQKEIVEKLGILGLDEDLAIKLISAFEEADKARDMAKNVWQSNWEEKQGEDYTTDIEKYQQQELESRQYFDTINEECALIIIARIVDPKGINEELLNKLYEKGIQEDQIADPALKITFHYYSESRAKDFKRNSEAEKIRGFSESVRNQFIQFKKKIQELEIQNKAIKKAYEELQIKYSARILSDENYYQSAIAQITLLQRKLSRLEEKKSSNNISGKLRRLFGKKVKELPEATVNLPKTLPKDPEEKKNLLPLGVTLAQTREKNDEENKKKQKESEIER